MDLICMMVIPGHLCIAEEREQLPSLLSKEPRSSAAEQQQHTGLLIILTCPSDAQKDFQGTVKLCMCASLAI